MLRRRRHVQILVFVVKLDFRIRITRGPLLYGHEETANEETDELFRFLALLQTTETDTETEGVLLGIDNTQGATTELLS